ncbi:MAG TPA: hypothetical protein DCM68_03455 [Verrucomicrobia bacterium]|nr:hypothetical protein [Verrucomicrobiota bacterium]
MNPTIVSAFAKLAWEDLKDWAGDRVVRRGKSYTSRVEDLCLTTDGALLAWVQGGDRYATLVRCTAAGKLSSTCTCPYGSSCKHAVAAVLRFLDCIQLQRLPPPAEADDERFDELANRCDPDEEEDEDLAAAIPPRRKPGDDAIRKHLLELPKNELVDLLMEGRDVIPELRQRLADQAELKEGNVPKMVAAIRKEIHRVTRDPGWQNPWKREGYTPDYSHLTQRLSNLLAIGQADAVVELGTELLKQGMNQAACSNDEGETGREVADALKVVYRALARSSLAPGQQILWDIDAHRLDPGGILDEISGPLAQDNQAAAVWSPVADQLAARLEDFPARKPDSPEVYTSAKFDRERLMNWLLLALEKAGRKSEIIPVLERETKQTDCYLALVRRLIQARRRQDARAWALKGIEATAGNLPGIATELQGELRNLAEKEKNLPLVAAYRAREFFVSPGLESFKSLQAAATQVKVWDVVRGMALRFLETGRRPDRANPAGKRKGKTQESAPDWPLPPTGLPEVETDRRRNAFPDASTLIDIAIHEKRPADVLYWFRLRVGQNGLALTYQGDKVAEAVADAHPDDAIAIWKEMIAAETATTNQAGYQSAGRHLRKIKQVAVHIGKETEWQAYLESLCLLNKRRPRMLDVLTALAGRRTPII